MREISAKSPKNVLLITCLSKNLTTRIEVLHHSLQIISERENIGEYAVVAENQPGHIDQIKQTNAGAVYRLIDQLGPVSRIDLSPSGATGSCPASITKIVREMLEAHLVQELEIKEEGGTVAVRQWGWWLKLKPGTIFLCALVAGRFLSLLLRDLSSKLVVEESQELALKR